LLPQDTFRLVGGEDGYQRESRCNLKSKRKAMMLKRYWEKKEKN